MNDFRESARIVIAGHEKLATRDVMMRSLLGSMALGGGQVRCVGIVPGVTMRVSTGDLQPQSAEQAHSFATEIWEKISPKLSEWLAMRNSPAGATMQLGDVVFEFGWDERRLIGPGQKDIVVKHESAATAAYLRQRRQRPLIERALSADELADRRWAEAARVLTHAVLKTHETTAPKLQRLPAPVRYRVTGAMAAWSALCEALDPILSPTMTDALKTLRIPRLMKHFETLARDLLPDGAEGYCTDVIAMASSCSAVWMAFEARGGAFYEPTPPLHRMLDAAYVADDVPIGMLALPVDTLCIIPEPSRWGQKGEVEAITIFRNAQSIGFVAWTDRVDGQEGMYMDALELSVDEPERTIRELVDKEFQGSSPEEEDARQLWRNALDYAIKMLLYLKARDAHIVHDRAYSNAPRSFNGLGKRRRAERLVEIEMLYDRHLVGPAILDAEPAALLPASDGTQREVRSHWRRPHFKMQPHGPHASLRKLVFIGPTIVRPDRLSV